MSVESTALAPAPGSGTAKPPPPPSLLEEILEWLRVRAALVGGWAKQNPAEACLLAGLIAVIVYFFGVLRLFYNYTHSTAGWAWVAWNPETNYEHGPLIPLIAFLILLHKLPSLRDEPYERSRLGIWWIVAGAVAFLLAARTLQPRIAMVALPFLLFGVILHTWGKRVGRPLFFPVMFLLFAVPLNFLQQATVNNLQKISTYCSTALCNFVGIKIGAVGTAMRALDESFQFEIAEGCSGINSLMAITMLTAIFVHFTQDRLWKKLVLFAFSALFAVVGNVARITAIMIVAKYGSAKFAGGVFHDYSAYVISFPFAFLAMWGASRLVNQDAKVRAWYHRQMRHTLLVPAPAAGGAATGTPDAPSKFDY